MSAVLPLRDAVRATLLAHASLTTLLGGAKVYDEVPPSASFPFITLGDSDRRDWSSATSTGEEHRLTLAVWSRHGGRKEAHVIAASVMQRLADAPLTLSGHTLINLRVATCDITREPDGRTFAARIRLRAITETP
jgi:hypothetical protein